MIHGEHKARDMARSLLPSTWRKGARRTRANIHRSARRIAREELSWLTDDPEAREVFHLTEVDKIEALEVSGLVWVRRGGDKVNPFIRWATATTRHLPQESRLSHVRGVLPNGVIGEHAVDHLRRVPAFEDPHERQRRMAYRSSRKPWWLDRGEHAELLREVLRAGGHALINRWLRARHFAEHAPSTPRPSDRPGRFIARRGHGSLPLPRLLLGPHDVLPFLDAVETCRSMFTAMDQFLRAFKQHRRDLSATVAALGLSE
ncbi:hypothetical protein P2318_04120 [Myxococcaceae bacterium GXIMD 01537]